MRTLWILLVLLVLATPVRAQSLDWEVEEAPAGPRLTWLRGARDGVLGMADCLADLQVSLFAEVTLLAGQLAMAASDVVGVVDDNPVTQHLFKGTASKSLARTAYLAHVAGSEAALGSHGLEAQWYIEAEIESLNPLLAGSDSGPRLPQDPLDFVGEGLVHTRVYLGHLPGSLLATSLVSDLILRPAGHLARIAGARETADGLEDRGRDLFRGVLE